MADQKTDNEVLPQIHDQNMKNAIASQQNGFGQGYYFGRQEGVVMNLVAATPKNLSMVPAPNPPRILNPLPESLNIWDDQNSTLIFLPNGFYTVNIGYKINTTANNSTCLVEVVDSVAGVIADDTVDLPRSGVSEPHSTDFIVVATGNLVTLRFTGSVDMTVEDVLISSALIMAPNPATS